MIEAMPNIRPMLDARPIREAGNGTNIAAADFGRIFLRQVNTPRQIQFGARVSF